MRITVHPVSSTSRAPNSTVMASCLSHGRLTTCRTVTCILNYVSVRQDLPGSFTIIKVQFIKTKRKYQGVKEFHILALIGCYCKMLVFSSFKLEMGGIDTSGSYHIQLRTSLILSKLQFPYYHHL